MQDFSLEQNHPNPFSAKGGSAFGGNPSTTIRFSLPKTAHVRLLITNLAGQEIVVLADENRTEGVHEVRWDGRDAHRLPVPAGVYLYRLEASPYLGTGKLLLLK